MYGFRIIPIPKGSPEIDAVASNMITELKAVGISAKYDNDDRQRPGFKFADYELKGVPVRIAIGNRDLEKNEVEIARRDTFEKQQVSLTNISEYVSRLLDDIQVNLFERSKKFRDSQIREVSTFEEFKKALAQGGFIKAYWDGTSETEEAIKQNTKATIRCIPLDYGSSEGVCVYSGKPSNQQVLFAISY